MSVSIFDIPKGYSTNEVIKFLMYHEFPIIPLNIFKYSIDKFESGLSRIAYLSKLKLYASFINFAKNERIFSQYILSFDMNKTYQYHIKNKSNHARYDYHEIDKMIKQLKL